MHLGRPPHHIVMNLPIGLGSCPDDQGRSRCHHDFIRRNERFEALIPQGFINRLAVGQGVLVNLVKHEQDWLTSLA